MSTNLLRLLVAIVLSIGIILNGFSGSILAMDAKIIYYDKLNKLQGRASYNLIEAIKDKLKEKGYYKNHTTPPFRNVEWEYDNYLEQALDKYRKDNGLENDKSLKKTLESLGLMNSN